MADLTHMTRDKRKRWQYRRHIPEPVRFRFKFRREFTRALPGPSAAERALQYLAAHAEYEAIATGKPEQRLIPRANDPNPPLSAYAMKISREIAAMPKGAWPVEAPEPDDPYTLAEAVKRFLSDPLRNATADTKKAHTPRLGTLCAILGPETFAAAITRDEYRRAVDTLYKLPREYRRKYADLTPQEAIERAAGGEPLFSAKTRSLYLETWGSFFEWCAAEGVTTSSPANAVRAPKVEGNKARRDAWKTPALNTLFSAPLYTVPEQRITRPGAFWLPIIALHQGMRCREIVLLDRSEVVAVEGVWCFDIRERPGRSLKTKASARIVSIHPELIRLGLLDHARSLPAWPSPSAAWPEGPLWPDLMVNKQGKPYGDPTDEYGKAFRDLAKELGLRTAEEGQEEGHVFHALRHRFASACRAARMPDSARLYLGGWAQKEGEASRYRKHDIPALKEELDKVCYSGVVLPEPAIQRATLSV